MNTKHTQGPWKVSKSDEQGREYLCIGAASQHVATVPHPRSKKITELEKANAALIAAAPDMYQALKELLEHIEWTRRQAGLVAGPNDCTIRANAALAKAEGK